jgi:hypothetical protein
MASRSHKSNPRRRFQRSGIQSNNISTGGRFIPRRRSLKRRSLERCGRRPSEAWCCVNYSHRRRTGLDLLQNRWKLIRTSRPHSTLRRRRGIENLCNYKRRLRNRALNPFFSRGDESDKFGIFSMSLEFFR